MRIPSDAGVGSDSAAGEGQERVVEFGSVDLRTDCHRWASPGRNSERACTTQAVVMLEETDGS